MISSKTTTLLFALLLLPVCALAQERFTVKGHIVNEKGEAVEYVQVGVPKSGIGVISSADGRFEINVPADTLEFHHVSYQVGRYPVSGPKENLLIVLKDSELPPAVAIGGDAKEKYLLQPGIKLKESLAGMGFDMRDGGRGSELGSVATARKPFLVQNIQFTILENYVPGCVAAINIYRIEGEPETFTNILHKPIYFRIPESAKSQHFDIQPGETILLEPGRYFIAFQIVDCDDEAIRRMKEASGAKRDPKALHLYTAMYLKNSYQRFSPLSGLQPLSINIGVAVKGLEYQ
jgi:hypothetical protein